MFKNLFRRKPEEKVTLYDVTGTKVEYLVNVPEPLPDTIMIDGKIYIMRDGKYKEGTFVILPDL